MDVTVYDLNGNEVTEVDNVWASFGEGVFNPDCLPMSSRGELLSTYGMTDNYMLEDSGRLSQINDYFMIMNNWEDDEWSLTLLQDLEVEARDSFDSDDIYTMPLKKGEKIVFYATDDDTYVDFKTQGGSFVRIYVDYSDYPQKVNGIDIDELFDGIMFAG